MHHYQLSLNIKYHLNISSGYENNNLFRFFFPKTLAPRIFVKELFY